MKVYLIKEKTILDYVQKHMNTKSSFMNWINLVKTADWEVINDMKETFNSADILVLYQAQIDGSFGDF